MALLEVHQLTAFHGDVQALWDVSFEVAEGSVTTLLGSNGAGKTTTLRAISGILPPRDGEILLGGDRIDRVPPHRIVDMGVVQVPEGRKLWPNMTVQENLLLGAYGKRGRPERTTTLRSVYELFPRLGERRSQLAGTLSGGEQQMVAIGRGLMARPALLMIDEPFLGLAPKLIEQIAEVISAINRKRGITIVFIEQNVELALKMAHRGYILESGP